MSKITDADKSLFTGPFVAIDTPEQLKAICEAAKNTFDVFDVEIAGRMTTDRAARIRQLRVDEGCTWRAVAEQSFEDWGEDATWQPSSNQLVGMALCKTAAAIFGEDYYDEGTWN